MPRRRSRGLVQSLRARKCKQTATKPWRPGKTGTFILVGILRLMATLAGIACGAVILGGLLGAAAAMWQWTTKKLGA